VRTACYFLRVRSPLFNCLKNSMNYRKYSLQMHPYLPPEHVSLRVLLVDLGSITIALYDPNLEYVENVE
jgi:hypothetical protein